MVVREPARFWRVPLDLDPSPARALAVVREGEWPFALTGSWAGGGAILGSDPVRVASPEEDPFELWDQLPGLEGEHPEGSVGGGWFGWLGYGAGSLIEQLPPQPPRPARLPATHLAYYDHVLRLDDSGRWWFEALLTGGREAAVKGRFAELKRLLAPERAGAEGTEVSAPQVFRPVAPGAAGHRSAVARCRERIHGGEFFQANLRLRLEADRQGDLATLFGAAIERVRPAYGAAFLAPWGGIASLSPELFLRRRGDLVETAPIKGTAKRPDDPGAAESAKRALLDSAKDAAEHVMIVDVARNDLGRVCRPGTVIAPDGPEAEPHPGLWHLVSTVSGRLNPGTTDGELLRATFPPCSVTGAPKIQAMRAIAELEPFGREVFTGAIGFSSPVAGLELNVAIRTFEAAGDRIWLDVGGGIVSDSDPERELDECFTKAGPLIEATGSRIYRSEGAPPTSSGAGIRWALDGDRNRPDPACGLIETIAVTTGKAGHLERHLGRLEKSLDRLYGIVPPDDLAELIRAAAAELGEGALRLLATPDGKVEVAERPVLARDLPVTLSPLILPGGLGDHKWADRRLVDDLSTSGATPLLVDLDGSVLEVSWGNIWIEVDGGLLTPPADGRILPGITREVLLKEGAWRGLPVQEESFGIDRLAAADRVLVSSSLAGLVPARLGGETGETGDR